MRAVSGSRIRLGGQHRQVDQPETVGWTGVDPGRELQRQPGLADAARPGERQQPSAAQRLTRRSDLTLPSDQRAQRRRQTTHRPPGRPKGRKIGREPIDDELVEPLRALDVLQPVGAEVAQIDPLRKLVLYERSGRTRDQHLPAVGSTGNPRRPMNVEAKVPVAASHAPPGMDAHTDADGGVLGPVLAREGALGFGRGVDRVGGSGEDGKEGLPFRRELEPASLADRLAQDEMVPLDHSVSVVPKALDEPRRALDVREQKGDDPGRQSSRSGRPTPNVHRQVPGAMLRLLRNRFSGS